MIRKLFLTLTVRIGIYELPVDLKWQPEPKEYSMKGNIRTKNYAANKG